MTTRFLERAAPEAGDSPAGDRAVRRATTIAIYFVVFFVALPTGLWVLGSRFDGWLGARPLPVALRIVGTALVAPGTWLILRAMYGLWSEGGGLPISHLPPRHLVSSGAFARLRHPIYAGCTIAFAGAGAASGSLGRGALSTGLLTLAWLAYAAGLEEPTLRRRFGESYERYAASTQRVPIAPSVRAAGLRAWLALRPGVERLANSTVLVRRGRTILVTYGLFVALGAAAAATLGAALFSSRMSASQIDEYLAVLVGALLVGGRIAWLVYNRLRMVRAPWATLRSVGFVSFGAYAAQFSTVMLWPRWRAPGIDPWWLLDRTLVSCFVVSAIGRIGCHTYGCCYGRKAPYGMRVGTPLSKVVREQGPDGHAPRWPTQLIGSLWALVAAGVGLLTLAASAPSGVSAALSVLVYALGRFGFESLRDEPRLFSDRFTRGQLACVALAATACGLLLIAPAGFAEGRGAPLSFGWSAALAHAPAIACVALLVFVVCGYHRDAIGRW